jgi:hypothetical protein
MKTKFCEYDLWRAAQGVAADSSAQSSFFEFRVSIFELIAARGFSISTAAVDCQLSATAYLPRNFSMVVSSASAMSRYFFAPWVSCFCMADWALEMSVFMRCWAETMSPRRP